MAEIKECHKCKKMGRHYNTIRVYENYSRNDAYVNWGKTYSLCNKCFDLFKDLIGQKDATVVKV